MNVNTAAIQSSDIISKDNDDNDAFHRVVVACRRCECFIYRFEPTNGPRILSLSLSLTNSRSVLLDIAHRT